MAEANRFGPQDRLRRRSEFLALYADADKYHSPLFVAYIKRNDSTRSRLGITASRKIGPPVVRNKIKRRLREIFREHRGAIQPPSDISINVKRRAAVAAFDEIRDSFLSVLQRWSRRNES